MVLVKPAPAPVEAEAEALAMPLHHGRSRRPGRPKIGTEIRALIRRMSKANPFLASRPNPVEAHPQQPVEGRKLRPTRPLSAQHGHLMTHGNQLKFQRGAAAKTEGEDRNKGEENRHHHVTVRPARKNHQPFSPLWKFEQGQGMPHVRICAGGGRKRSSLPRHLAPIGAWNNPGGGERRPTCCTLSPAA